MQIVYRIGENFVENPRQKNKPKLALIGEKKKTKGDKSMEHSMQLSLFDFLSPTEKISFDVGKYNDSLGEHKGKQILFAELKNYVGEKIIYETHYEQLTPPYQRKVILVKNFYEDNGDVWVDGSGCLVNDFLYNGIITDERKKTCRYLGKVSRLGYSGSPRLKEDSWISELYCKGGRYDEYITRDDIKFYEIA